MKCINSFVFPSSQVKVVSMLSQTDDRVPAEGSPISKHECEKLSQMVSNGVAAGQQGVRQVEDVVFNAAPELSSNQVSCWRLKNWRLDFSVHCHFTKQHFPIYFLITYYFLLPGVEIFAFTTLLLVVTN